MPGKIAYILGTVTLLEVNVGFHQDTILGMRVLYL